MFFIFIFLLCLLLLFIFLVYFIEKFYKVKKLDNEIGKFKRVLDGGF